MTNSTLTPIDNDTRATISYKKIENTFLLPEDKKIEKYKFMKLDVISFLDGLTRGNWSVKDKFGKFFDHIEEMFFGKKISILDDRVL